MDSFSSLAKKAKNRLNQRSEYREKTKSVCLRAEKNYLASSNASLYEKDFVEKVEKIMQEGDELHALSRLIDKNIFDSLDATKKLKYVLDTSKKYLTTRDKFVRTKIAIE